MLIKIDLPPLDYTTFIFYVHSRAVYNFVIKKEAFRHKKWSD